MTYKRKVFPRLMALFLVAFTLLSMLPESVLADQSGSSEPFTDTAAAENTVQTETIPQEETPAENMPADGPEALSSEPGLTSPTALSTEVTYYDDFFAELHARQDDVQYRILTSDAVFCSPQINAYTFEADPTVESIGFEVRLSGVDFVKEPCVNPGAEVCITVKSKFLDASAAGIRIFDISRESWQMLTLDQFRVHGEYASVSFYTPDINSRFAVMALPADAATYDVSYGTVLGDFVPMAVNNQYSWGVRGKNPYGFGNSNTGTFALHLVRRPDTDPTGKGVGKEDFVAAGCLEYWKAAPLPTKGQIVDVNYAGLVEGWSRLTVEQRREIVGYLLYGVRYLSDGSFAKPGPPSIGSTNHVVNMTYAQQILIWSTVKGVDPYKALQYYMNDVFYYGKMIIQLSQENPENYDYDRTRVLVGEGGSKQDVAIILKPEKITPPSGEIVVDKTVTGSDRLDGWKIELYRTQEEAAAGTNPIEAVVTDSVGRAVFPEVLNGTYYLREAPAIRQEGDLTYWQLSDQVFTVIVNNDSVNAGTIHNTYKPDYAYRLHKVSGCDASIQQQIADNRMYSLAGARYQVMLDGKQQEILTTDDQGNACGTRKYPAGTRLVIQEIEAPPGYKLDPTEYPLLVTAGDNVLEVKDTPLFDPPFSITKIDKITEKPQGGTSFIGAIFKWEYFDNLTWEGKPVRTWYFQTDANGICDYAPDHLADGYTSDPLYIDGSGNPDIPLGSVRMTEVRNSLGYIVLPSPLLVTVISDPGSLTGVKHAFTPESMKYIKELGAGSYGVYEPINTDLLGAFVLDKIDGVTGPVPQGNLNLTAKFRVINRSANPVQIDTFPLAAPGDVCYEFTTDESGHFTSGKVFPLGTYVIEEAVPPAGYELNADWRQKFTVTEADQSFDFSASSGLACPDMPDLIGSVSMNKLDADTGAGPQGDGRLEGAEFELVNNSKNPVSVNGISAAPGQLILKQKTDPAGHLEISGLPIGRYILRECTPPEGYQLNIEWQYEFEITAEKYNIEIESHLTCEDYIVRGGLKIIKQDSAFGENTPETAPLDGITFNVTNESQYPVLIDGVSYDPGEVIEVLAISWDGQLWSAETGKNLPYGTYGVTENEMYSGMANESYTVNRQKHLVQIRESAAQVSVVHVNGLAEGKIIVHKVDPLGKPLAGARFLLQWSDDDGSSWNAVNFTTHPVRGGCVSPNLEDGTLTTGEDGLITFTGLYPTLKYRVIEVKAPEGYVLLCSSAFEGYLPGQEFVYEMTVHNSPGFTFPTTGSMGLYGCLFTGLSMFCLAGMTAVYLSFRKKRAVLRNR